MAILTPDELVQLATSLRDKSGSRSTAASGAPQQAQKGPNVVHLPAQEGGATAAPDWNQTLVAMGYDPGTNMLAICPDDWDHFDLDNCRATSGERLAKSLFDAGRPFGAPLFGFGSPLLKSQEADKNKPPVGGASGGERWITMHPNGDEEKGVPVRISLNHDGSWSVAGGAGGKLNGLRLTDVKSPEEYKHVAAEKAKARKEKAEKDAQEHLDKLKETHRAQVETEAKASGKDLTPEELEHEAGQRAAAEYREKLGDQAQGEKQAREEQREKERAYVAHVAKAQGWDENDYQLSPEAKQELQEKGVAPRVISRIEAKHHALAFNRAKEVEANLRELVVSAADGISKETMGDVAVGDLVHNTLGDAGKGYVANLTAEAAARGMDITAIKSEAENQNAQSLLKRHDGDFEAAGKAKTFVERAQQGAAKARADVQRALDQLGENGQSLSKIEDLDTLPKVQDAKSALEHLATLKQLGQGVKDAAKTAKAVADVDPLDTLPKAAVVTVGPELSHADALEQVQHDLEEKQRQKAMDGLLDCYNAQDAVSPLVSHRLSGHNSFFGNVAQLAGIRSPDPLSADILGPSGIAHVMRRAMENAAGDDKAKTAGLKAALEAHHVEKQVAIADQAVERAKELLNQADHLADFPIDSMDSLLAGLDQAKRKNDLVKEAREHLGLGLGRLEAGAALNEAFMGAKADDVQIALGAISMEDAVRRAGALGLTKADQFGAGGDVKAAGQYRIHNDGKNKILVLHGAGLDHLASQLSEDPEHLKRAALVADIKAGKHDEANWLPKGFSRRPAIDVSGGDGLVIPRHDLQLDLNGCNTPASIAKALKAHIGARIEAGQDPILIANALRSQLFRADHVSEDKEDAYSKALALAIPDRKGSADALAHQATLRAMFEGYHRDFIRDEVKAGRLDSSAASLHLQTLPQDHATRDLVHQVALQDPRFAHAFSDVGALSHIGRRALRQYAYEHVFRDEMGKAYDPKDKETPTQPLSPSERSAWEKWRDLSNGGKGNPYDAIQKHLAQTSAKSSGGGLFGDEEDDAQPHAFASLNLADDAAVLSAAKAHANELGLGFQLTPDGQRVYPDLDAGENKSDSDVAAAARAHVKGYLRSYAMREMFHTPGLAASSEAGTQPNYHKVFNPESVHTGSHRWAEYVAAMGGGDKESEKRAYTSIQEKMKGDFAARFAKGYKQLHGKEFQAAPVPLTFADPHAVASLPGQKRKEVEAQNKSQRAKLQNRDGALFSTDNTGAKLDAAKQESLLGDSLFAVEDAKEEKQQLDTHRLSLGGAAEAMIGGMMPNISLKKGTSAAGDINMSSGLGVKRQRAIKQWKAAGRIGLTLGVGSGKTAIALGTFSDLRAEGKVKRALLAVPSVVQEQFGSEAARFYDLTDKNHPQWHSDAGASPQERRAAYHKGSGKDICVVTHQALRDDLQWALAQHKFDGDENAASAFLESAPETERNQAMKAAMAHHGWDFDMSAVDEGHNLLNRAGKENSGMANAIDAFTHDKPYHGSLSADPVKNDVSEGFDLLRKVAPSRYVGDDHPDVGNGKTISRAEFLRKYDVNTPAAMEALQRELEPYHYAESIKPESELDSRFHPIPMTEPQQRDYNNVIASFQKARAARKRGRVDVEAVKTLSPSSFEGAPAEEHEAIAGRLAGSLGILRDSALDRVVNQHPEGAKLEWLDERLGLKPKSGKYGDFDVKKPDENFPTIFAHNLGSVDLLRNHLAKRGFPTAHLVGGLSGQEKEKAKLGFSPQFDKAAGKYVTDPTSNIMVSSDAGAVGWNGQRSRHVIHWDMPHTAMVHEQRTGRAHRIGQEHDVSNDTVFTDTPYERSRRKRLERKGAMRDALTSPAELIDDSGLAHRITEQTAAARAHLVKSAIDGATDTQTQTGPTKEGDN